MPRLILRRLLPGLACLVVSHSATGAESLETMEITASPATPGQVKSLLDLEDSLATVPGGTNLISLEDMPNPVTLSDALGNQPGVVVQEFFGGLDQPRLNIRGSGLQANPVSRGVLIRENGLPANEADGSFIIGLLDLAGTAAISVHRGANSRVPGALTLGGDIDFIGQVNTADGDSFYVESGSFSRQSFLINHQRESDHHFYRLGFYEASAEGYRHHSESSKSVYRISGGFDLAPGLSGQYHLRYSDLHFDMPFVLTKERAENDPRSVYGDGGELFDIGLNMYARDPHRSVSQLRFSQQLSYQQQGSTQAGHQLGLYWQATDDAFVDPMSHIETDATLLGAQYLFDHYPTGYLHYQLGLDHNHSDMPRNYFGNHPLNGDRIAQYAEFDLQAENTTGSLLANLTLFPEWTLSTHLQFTQSERRGIKAQYQSELNKRWEFWTPRIGLIYQPALADLRLFANLSRATEVPTYWEFIGTRLNPILTYLSEAFFLDLRPQKSDTLEIGGQYRWQQQVLDISLYRSELERELMSTASQYGVIANALNYDGTTIHQGVELGIKGPLGIFRYQATWNYSDFYFKNGVFTGKQIAGVPEHILSGKLLYQGETVQTGPTVTWVPGNNPADHLNTLDHEGYLLWGWKFLWQSHRHITAHLVVNNLFDTRYNSTYVIREESSPDLPTFLPGNGFSVMAGVRLDLPNL